MPFKDKQDLRDYQRLWRRSRRAAFFHDKKCVDCGATEELELDHRDPDSKVASGVWSWAQERQDEETAKCDVRCGTCHRKRHAEERKRHGIGSYQRGCRCTDCRAAKSAAMKREKRRAVKSNHSRVLGDRAV